MANSEHIGPGHSGSGLRHALAFAGVIQRRCWVNREATADVAEDLDVSLEQVRGVAQMVHHLRGTPSQQRLIAAAMRDWGLDDSDLAEMFGVTVEAVACVRRNAAAIRLKEPIPAEIEIRCAGLLPDDVSPSELYARARAVRKARPLPGPPKSAAAGIRRFTWDGFQHAFIPRSA